MRRAADLPPPPVLFALKSSKIIFFIKSFNMNRDHQFALLFFSKKTSLCLFTLYLMGSLSVSYQKKLKITYEAFRYTFSRTPQNSTLQAFLEVSKNRSKTCAISNYAKKKWGGCSLYKTWSSKNCFLKIQKNANFWGVLKLKSYQLFLHNT